MNVIPLQSSTSIRRIASVLLLVGLCAVPAAAQQTELEPAPSYPPTGSFDSVDSGWGGNNPAAEAVPEIRPGNAPPPMIPRQPQNGGVPDPQAVPLAPGTVPEGGELFEPAKILAKVGDEYILVGDILWSVNLDLEQYQAMDPREQQAILHKPLLDLIDMKLLYVDFLRKIPRDRVEPVMNQVIEQFDEKELPKRLEAAKANSPRELDEQLRRCGSSLNQMRRQFAEQVIAREILQQNIHINEEVRHDELLAYYYDHIDQFEYPARARWEELMVRFDQFPDRTSAYRAIGAMGNEVINGAPLEAVAKRSSQGGSAQRGGLHDWTSPGSLVLKEIDQAIFSLPLNRLSQIIETREGFHIVRVLERHEAGRIPFFEAQVDIKEKIRQHRRKEEITRYVTRLRMETYIWTAFDGENPYARTANQPGQKQR